jgi:hypothetical protein
VEFWIREINCSDVNRTVEALKAVCNQLKEDETVLLFYIDPLGKFDITFFSTSNFILFSSCIDDFYVLFIFCALN